MSSPLPTFLSAARRFLGDRAGSITVEFIAVLPMLLGVLALTYETGRGLWAQQIVTKDLREAARYLSREGLAPLSSTVKTQAENLARSGALAGGPAHFPWTAGATFTVNDTYRSFSNTNFRETGTVVQVRADVPLTLSFLNIFSVFGVSPSVTLTAESQVRLIGD